MIRAIKHFLAKRKAVRAYRLEDAGRRAEARAVLETAAEDLRGEWRMGCLNKIGMLSYDLGEFDAACRAYERALSSQPDDATVLMNLANARDRMNDAARAAGAYERALQVEPMRADILFNYGVFLEKRDPAQAFRRVRESIEACNAHPDWNGDLAASFLVKLAVDQGRSEEALQFFGSLEARARDEVARTCRLGRVQLLSNLGRHEAADEVRREHVEHVVRSAANVPGMRAAITEHQTELVVRNSRRKSLLLLFGVLAFSCIGVFLFAKGDRDLSTWLGLAFFGGIGIPVALYQVFDTRPRLVINNEGITDRTLRVGLIPWAEIVGGELRSIFGQEFIALRLRDPRLFLERVGPVRRKFMVANKLLTSSELNLNLSGLPVRGRDVLRLISQFCDVTA